MSVTLSYPPAFGIEFQECQFLDKLEEDNSIDYRKDRNTRKIIGYTPLIGTIMGIFRIFSKSWTNQDLKPNLAHKIRHVIRGIIEMLSLGFLLIIPDLIVTYSRESAWQAAYNASQY